MAMFDADYAAQLKCQCGNSLFKEEIFYSFRNASDRKGNHLVRVPIAKRPVCSACGKIYPLDLLAARVEEGVK